MAASSFERALGLYRSGRAVEAESACRQIVKAEPGNFPALLLLGSIAAERGDFAAAAPYFTEALRLNPNNPDAWDTYGSVLERMGRKDEALAAFERAIALNPKFAEAHFHQGDILLDMKRSQDALASYDHSIALEPNFAGAHCNRGNALQDLGRLQDALASYGKAIALAPDFADALFNRGSTLHKLKRYREALACYDRAATLEPQNPIIWCNRAATLTELERGQDAIESCNKALEIAPGYPEGFFNRAIAKEKLDQWEDALADYDHVIALDPKHAGAFNNRGTALSVLKRLDEALASFARAIAIKPDFVEVYTRRATLLNEMNRFDEAAADYDQALAIDPDKPETLYLRAGFLCGRTMFDRAIPDLAHVLEVSPDYEYGLGQLLHARMHCCDWTDLAETIAAIDAGLEKGKRVIAPFPYQGIVTSPEKAKICSEIFAAGSFPPKPAILRPERYSHKKIRVGYVSGEFREQATAYLMMGVWEKHDKNEFEIYALDNSINDGGPTRKRIEGAFDAMIGIAHEPDHIAAPMIAAHEIDIMVNLNGYFGAERSGLFARRAAPIQVNYLGFPATLGMPYMDYILADTCVIPEDERGDYTEEVVYLPDTYQATDSNRMKPAETPTRAACGLPEDGFVFCSFNNSYKLTPDIFDRWVNLLKRVPGSVLWILQSNKAMPDNLRREAAARGVDPKRLIFAPFVGQPEHLARQKLGDLFLDSLPYNAHTTASDALWMGLPIVTCKGTAFPGRVAASLLQAVGLPEMITTSLDEYESLAAAIATDKQRLANLKDRLARQRGAYPLFDTDRFRRHIEAAYKGMWERHRRGLKPEGFAVEPVSRGV